VFDYDVHPTSSRPAPCWQAALRFHGITGKGKAAIPRRFNLDVMPASTVIRVFGQGDFGALFRSVEITVAFSSLLESRS
jgi:hypothetical protein